MWWIRFFVVLLALGLVALLISAASAGVGAFTAETAESSGTVVIRDSDESKVGDKLSDMAIIKIVGVPELGLGRAYQGWLISDDDTRKVSTGFLARDAEGNINQTFMLTGDNTGENLFAEFSKFVVTVEQDPNPDPGPSGDVVYSHTIPQEGMGHIRHLLFSWPVTPPYQKGFHKGTPKGIATGLRMQAWHALVHARLSDGSKDIEELQANACHVVNIIEGTGLDKGENYDAVCGIRGDGFGMLSYANDTAVHARLAAEAVPEDPVIGVHSKEAIFLAGQVMDWATEARDQALLALMSNDLGGAQLLTTNMVGLLDKAFEGSQQTYRAVQDMGQYTLGSLAGAEESDPKLPPTGGPNIPGIALASLLIGACLLLSGAYIHWRRTGSRARTTWPV